MNVYILTDKKYYNKIPLLFDDDIIYEAHVVLNTKNNVRKIINHSSKDQEKGSIVFILCDVSILDEDNKNNLTMLLKRKTANYCFICFGDKADEFLLSHYKCINVSDDKDVIIARDFISKEILQLKKDRLMYSHLKKTSYYSLILISSILGIMSILLIYFWDDFSKELNNNSMFIESAILVFVFSCLITFLSTYLIIFQKKVKKEDDNILDEYSYKLRNTFNIENSELYDSSETNKSIDNNTANALDRMLINLEDIKEFYTWSQRQAKTSFIFAVVLCALGFLLITFSIVSYTVFNVDIPLALISSICGAIVEMIAGTALIVYKTSLTQLNYYHRALHEDERFLSSANLLNHFRSDENHDDMLKEIIRSEIQMNINMSKQENIKD